MTTTIDEEKSILPPEMEAKRLAIRKRWLWIVLPSIIPVSMFAIPAGLKWAVEHNLPTAFCAVGELAFICAFIFLEFRILQIYVQHLSEKSGFVCPSCHKSLFQPGKNSFGKVETTGRCPCCKAPVVANVDLATIDAEEQAKEKLSKKRLWWKLAVLPFVLLGIFIRSGGLTALHHESPLLAAFSAKNFDQTILEANAVIRRQLPASGNPSDAVPAARKQLIGAYYLRSAAYEGKGNHAAAEDDISIVLSLAPLEADLYVLRAMIYIEAGQLDKATSDIQTVTSIDPNTHFLPVAKGELDLLQGDYASAAVDFGDAVKQLPKEAQQTAWLHIVRHHLDHDDTAIMAATRGSLPQEWPSSVVDLFVGTASVDAVREQAALGEPDVGTHQACDAEYYIGEYYLEKNDRQKAQESLTAAVASCPDYSSTEKQAAALELKAQGFGAPAASNSPAN
jgi:lipoprotein NlpI